MERIPNPVTGSLDDGSMPAGPLTPLMVVCRYALALLTPSYVAAAVVGAEQLPWWWLFVAYIVVLLPLTVGAHGSWWRSEQWGAWQASGLAAGGVLVVGLIVSVATGERFVMLLASTLVVGGVLGVGASQLWRARGEGAL